MDVKQISDGRFVIVRRIDSETILNAKYLPSKTHGNGDTETKPWQITDNHNHCVPILDLLEYEKEPNTTYLILPCVRDVDGFFSGSVLSRVLHVVDFVTQVLEVSLQ